MLHRLKAAYLPDRNYALLYAHSFFHSIASAAMYVFTGAYFLKLGMPLPFVLLFYGLEFGVRGFLCPLGLRLLHKLPLTGAMALSGLLQILFFIGVFLAKENLLLGFASLFLAAMAGAIYYPFSDIIEAIFVKEDHNRAKQYSLSLVCDALGGIAGTALVGFLTVQGGFGAAVAFIGLTILLSVIPFFFLRQHIDYRAEAQGRGVYRFFFSRDFKPLWAPFFGEQLTIVLRCVMVPLFVFSITQKMDDLGYLLALTIVVRNICVLLGGRYTDRQGPARTMKIALPAYAAAMAGYLFLAPTPLALFLSESLHKTTSSLFIPAFRMGLQLHVKKKHKTNMTLFATCWQMALCFGELIVLPLYALLAVFIGMKVFYLSCGIAFFGLWLMKSFFKKDKGVAQSQ